MVKFESKERRIQPVIAFYLLPVFATNSEYECAPTSNELPYLRANNRSTSTMALPTKIVSAPKVVFKTLTHNAFRVGTDSRSVIADGLRI